MEEKNDRNVKQQKLIGYFKSQEKEFSDEAIAKRWDSVLRHHQSFSGSRVRKLWIQVTCAAAMLCGIVGGSVFYLERQASSIENEIARLDAFSADTVRQVLLITHASQQIEAGDKASISYTKEGKAIVNQHQVASSSKKTEFNQLIVPKGKFSHLLLADGTSLHVNSGTKVIYPSVFTGNTREIYVDGEIFIDVAKNPEQPFIVKTSDFDIRVTGTAFNVNAYKELNEAEVVLVRGSILIKDGLEQETPVRPNELLRLAGGMPVSRQVVDTEEYTAWTEGRFPLQGRSMESILKRLSLYYGCEVTCDPDVARLALRGTIDMSVPLPVVLERIAKLHPLLVQHTADGGYHLLMNLNY